MTIKKYLRFKFDIGYYRGEFFSFFSISIFEIIATDYISLLWIKVGKFTIGIAWEV